MQTSNHTRLAEGWDLPPEISLRLGEHAGHQRMLEGAGHLLLVLHAPPKPYQHNRGARCFWRDSQGRWFYQVTDEKPLSLEDHLTEYEQYLDRLDNLEPRTDSVEDFYEVLETLTPLLRSIRHMHQVLQEARVKFSEAHELINIRDLAYKLLRTSELLYASCKNGLEIAVARNSEIQARESKALARSAHRLNLFVAFFFPVATLSGIVSIQQGLKGDLLSTNGILTVAGCVIFGIVITGFINGSRKRWHDSQFE